MNDSLDNRTIMTQPSFSFEFFPPKTAEGAEKLRATRQQLFPLGPKFVSVTFGAGGSTQQGTLDTVVEIQREGVEAAPTFLASVRPRTTSARFCRRIANTASATSWRCAAICRREWGDRRVSLRVGAGRVHSCRNRRMVPHRGGGLPGVPSAGEVAAPGPRAFRPQGEGGANAAITQYFFNADAYFRFVDDASRLGVDVPIVPGIMPITNYSQMMRFSEMCGAEVPRWIAKRLEGFGDDRDSIRAFGLDVVTALCERLLAQGVPGLHFYTLNAASATKAMWQRLGL